MLTVTINGFYGATIGINNDVNSDIKSSRFQARAIHNHKSQSINKRIIRVII